MQSLCKNWENSDDFLNNFKLIFHIWFIHESEKDFSNHHVYQGLLILLTIKNHLVTSILLLKSIYNNQIILQFST